MVTEYVKLRFTDVIYSFQLIVNRRSPLFFEV